MSLKGNAKSGGTLMGKINGLKTIHGYSAYEVAVVNGFEGTEEEWLASLKGEQGEQGKRGERGIQTHYDADTHTLFITGNEESGGATGGGSVDLSNYYDKDEINAMFGSYVDTIAEIVGGDS